MQIQEKICGERGLLASSPKFLQIAFVCGVGRSLHRDSKEVNSRKYLESAGSFLGEQWKIGTHMEANTGQGCVLGRANNYKKQRHAEQV